MLYLGRFRPLSNNYIRLERLPSWLLISDEMCYNWVGTDLAPTFYTRLDRLANDASSSTLLASDKMCYIDWILPCGNLLY